MALSETDEKFDIRVATATKRIVWQRKDRLLMDRRIEQVHV